MWAGTGEIQGMDREWFSMKSTGKGFGAGVGVGIGHGVRARADIHSYMPREAKHHGGNGFY